MEIYYEPDLLEEIIRMELERREEEEGDLKTSKEYNSLREPLYDLPKDDDETEEAFEELDKKFFATLGLDGGIEEMIEEFPAITEQVGLMEIRRAFTREEESVNISNRHLDTGDKAAIIRLRSQCFLNPEGHRRVLRHELMHLQDVLDDDFAYNINRFGKNPSEEAFIRDRFRTIWDIYIESRLEREGKDLEGTEYGKGDCIKEFNVYYSKIPEKERNGIFKKLWEKEKMTHTEIVALASDPYKLIDLINEDSDDGEKKVIALPGAACPLCNFPTYDPVHDISEEAEDAIREDFPDWNAGWACGRCMDLYSLKTT